MTEKQAAKILGTLGYEIRTPGQACPKPLWSEEQAYHRMLADRMRYLLDSPRETDKSVLRRRLVVVSGRTQAGNVTRHRGRVGPSLPSSQVHTPYALDVHRTWPAPSHPGQPGSPGLCSLPPGASAEGPPQASFHGDEHDRIATLTRESTADSTSTGEVRG